MAETCFAHSPLRNAATIRSIGSNILSPQKRIAFSQNILSSSCCGINLHHVVTKERTGRSKVSRPNSFRRIDHFRGNPLLRLGRCWTNIRFVYKKFNRRRARYPAGGGGGGGDHATEIGVTRRKRGVSLPLFPLLFVLGGNYVGRARRR